MANWYDDPAFNPPRSVPTPGPASAPAPVQPPGGGPMVDVQVPDKLLDAKPQINDAGEVLYHNAQGKLVPTDSTQHAVQFDPQKGYQVFSTKTVKQEQPIEPFANESVGSRLLGMFSPIHWATGLTGAATDAPGLTKKAVEGTITPNEETRLGLEGAALYQPLGIANPQHSLGAQVNLAKVLRGAPDAAAAPAAPAVPRGPFPLGSAIGAARGLFALSRGDLGKAAEAAAEHIPDIVEWWNSNKQHPAVQGLDKAGTQYVNNPNKVTEQIYKHALVRANQAYTDAMQPQQAPTAGAP